VLIGKSRDWEIAATEATLEASQGGLSSTDTRHASVRGNMENRMLAIMKKLKKKNRRAQGMTEYIIIVGLIAIVLITAVNKFKGALGGAFDAASGKITSDVTGGINGAGTAAAATAGPQPAAPAAPVAPPGG
jgi:Flp pilus assembly pilin Flp